ncbi:MULTISPECIES: sugar porter family MFS transporter [unclassified Actinopolyspora]|uniref:sugar porter family MFS transporter n=1 Tax=unclassified Actinopolyspora TaxID=2639451 RepID=UPI0013F60105|nr:MULTISPECIES: sugar porter family MFS transporter [unclassified Actinopolyspora]NHD16989.1 sugar porter family MFS transporter [Actinopolyspora sp. BKK2]NHE76141.1 sugar porter family MFS transporter [Actinopolyspora sp. BKK1]
MTETKQRHGSARSVYLPATICAIGALLFGYDTRVISGALLYLKGPLGIADNEFLQGLVTSGILVGAMVGALTSGSLAARLGRRMMTLIAACVFALGSLWAAFSPDVANLVLARFVIGIGVGLASVIVPMYIAEISPTRIRGTLTSLNQLLITTGILLAYIVDYALAPWEAWRWMLGLAVIPAVALFIGMLFMPETPRWLASRDRTDEARAVLERTRPPEEVEEGFEEIRAAQRQTGEQLGWRDLTAKWIRPALFIGIGLAVLQQFVGINTIIYYAPTTLTQLGMGDGASIAAQVGIGTVMLLFTLIAVRYTDRIGRKRLLLTGSTGMSVSLGVLGILTLIVGASGQTVAIITVICLATYIASFGATWGPVVWVMLPELYPLRIRGPAEGLATWSNWAANFVVSLAFPVVLGAIGQGWSMLIFAALGVLSFVFVSAFVPETTGRSLEGLEADLHEGPAKEGIESQQV